MKKFLIGIVVGFLLAGMAALVVFFAFVRLGERPPVIADGSTLILRLEGDLPERAPMEFPLPWVEAKAPQTVLEVWSLLRKAAADSRIKAVVLMPRGLSLGWGKLEEVRGALENFRRGGKPLVAWLRNPGTREYYLATAADHIYMTSEDLLDVKGLRAEAMFFRGTLDKVGVQMEVEHIGRYKDGGDVFTRTSMTPESREVLNSILDGIFGRLVEVISSGRKKSPEAVRALVDEGPFLATQAKAKGLVDDLLYEDQVYEEVRRRLGQSKLLKVSQREYQRVPALALGLEGRQRVAVIVAQGAILRMEESPFDEDDTLASGSFIKLLRQVGDDPLIRGALVRVDSPGGDAVASDDILREMKLLSQKKPVVISMSDVAASGGYYLAMTGDPIVTYPNTITGSIGVYFVKANLRGLYDKIGIQKELLTRGRMADVDSDYKPLSEGGRKKLREGLQVIYDGFVHRVAEGRRMKDAQVEPLAQGRAWLGSDARKHGLADETGGLDKALELLRQKAKIPAGEKIRLITYPPRRSFFDLVFSRPSESAFAARLRALIADPMARLVLDGSLAHGVMLRMMPFTIRVE